MMGVAALQNNRQFIGIEKERCYFDIVCQKIKQADADKPYGSLVAITWEPVEMAELYSPLPYGKGDRFGKLFESDWSNLCQDQLASQFYFHK